MADKPVQQVQGKSERAQREEKILQFWKDNKIFQKSLEKPAPKGEFVFYDGPPFATGMPHFGHILPGTIKDVIPRYKTMRGYKVPRRWGWDCHGLPIENLIEKELGLETKKDIEKFGIDKFNERAKASVLRFEKEWKEIIPRTGRWVDMDTPYKTMDSSYTESVWWSFKELYDKGLVYQGFKTMHLCPRCGTTLSNFEVNLGYKDITDISVYVKFELVDELGTYLLAWTTTPWTLPGNAALAVNPEFQYVKAKKDGNTFFILKDMAGKVLKEGYEIEEEISGSKLVGKKYKSIFDYYQPEGRVVGADFVTAEDGTGIVHIAPAFGEDDYNLSLKENLPFFQHVGMDGRFKPEVRDFAGEYAKPKDDPSNPSGQAHQAGDVKIIKHLAANNLLFAKEKLVHSYPHCWRCDTPLLNYASSSWFVKVTEIKKKLLEANSKVRWVPEDMRDGRFGKWLEGARDWAVSRSRFWGTPLPVWQNADGSKQIVVDSLDTLKKYAKKSGNKYFLMRHGEAEHNVKNIEDLSGDPDNHLTEKGKEQASKVSGDSFHLVFASPFPRTKETAGIVKKDYIVDEHLHESGPEESEASIKKRIAEFLFEIETKHQGKHILIVSHGKPLWHAENLLSDGKKFDKVEMLGTGEVREVEFFPYPHNTDFELDFHRPYIDEIVLEKDGEDYRRVPEVFDTWYDSGSVPFASRKAKDFKPADFIAEGLDQTRGWFYTTLVLSSALFGSSPYKNVVVNGLILAEDGRKMSKRLKNYSEITDVLDKFGGDAMRYFLVSSPAVRADDFAFSEKGLDEVGKKIITRLYNVVSFYEMYLSEASKGGVCKESVLDKWLDARLAQTLELVTKGLEEYELDRAARPILDFVDDLSTWYLRRSRNRPEALQKLREVLVEFLKILAPFMPFAAEDLYQKLKTEKDPESVHLCEWPMLKQGFVGQAMEKIFGGKRSNILENMAETRRLVSLGLEARSRANVKVRQPLARLAIKNLNLPEEYAELIRDEVNVKEVVVDKNIADEVELDINITPELEEEGRLREVIRAIQEIRKEKNLKPGDKMPYEVKDEEKELFAKYAEEIKKATNIEF